MAVPSHQAIYNLISNGRFWQRIAIAVSNKQRTVIEGATGVMAANVKDWVSRNHVQEAQRIAFWVLGTSPVATKLDDPDSVTDADIDAALNTLYPNLLKAI